MASEHDSDSGSDIDQFYQVIRNSYTREELREYIARSDLAVRVAKIRGLIPWDYDGEREDVHKRTTSLEARDFEFPPPPQWGEAA